MEMITDLMENGFDGAAGATIIVVGLIAILVVCLFCAMFHNSEGEDNNDND